MLGEFMTPEVRIRCTLVNPVFVHVCEQVVPPQALDEGGN